MADIGIINVRKRTATSSRENKRLRLNGYLPGSVYGKDFETLQVAVAKDEIRKALNKYGANSVFKLNVQDGESCSVMVKNIQRSPVSIEPIHVEFHSISLTEEVKTEVALEIKGKEIVEELNKYVLMRQTDVVLVKGLPQDIPNFIEIDVSDMKPGDGVYAGDLKMPDGITLETPADHAILTVSEPKRRELPESEEAETETETSEETES